MRYIIVKCPKCRESLEIDTMSGAVVRHSSDLAAKGEGGTLADRLKGLEEEKAKRAAVVAQSKEREKTRKDQIERLFGEVKDKAKEEPEKERPLREFDLD